MTEHLLTLGIFDDGDRLPVQYVMLIDSPEVTKGQVLELLIVATAEHPCSFPASAQFWDCHPAPDA